VTCVIDASAIIALIHREPGADKVAEVIGGAIASAVIYAECLSKLASRGHDPDRLGPQLLATGLSVAEVRAEDVRAVVALHHLAKRNVSLADRFCLALALDRGLPLYTADRPWAALDLPVDLRLIR
jgi:PIN domain nuclease of toxin-antitoxin system